MKTKVSSLIAARLEFEEPMISGSLKDVIPEHQFKERADSVGWCGWRAAYTIPEMLVLMARMHRVVIPSGAADAQYELMKQDEQYSHFKLSELKTLARDMVYKRTPPSVKYLPLCFIPHKENQRIIHAVGINMNRDTFTMLANRAFEDYQFKLTVAQPNLCLHEMPYHIDTQTFNASLADTESGMKYLGEFSLSNCSQWKGSLTEIKFSGVSNIHYTANQIAGICAEQNEHDIECTKAIIGCEMVDKAIEYTLAIGASEQVRLVSWSGKTDTPFNFGRGDVDTPGLTTWYYLLNDVVHNLFALTGGVFGEDDE